MNRSNRLYSRPAIALAALIVLTSGCLVVVEKDDDDRRDRHRHLYAEWTVDIIVYRTESLAASERDVTVTFDESGRLTALADCGEITGSFDVNDSNGLTVSGLAASDGCDGSDRTFDLFRQTLSEARAYDATESDLRISSRNDGMIGLSAR